MILSRKTSKLFKIFLLVVIFFSISGITALFQLILFNENSSNQYIPSTDKFRIKSSGYNSKIHINDNWTAAKSIGICTGNGLPGDPYIIEDFIINAEGEGFCILIENSNDYFIIRNCTIFSVYEPPPWPPPYQTGIKLYNIANGFILNNSCFDNTDSGIYLEKCDNVNFSHNIIRFNGYCGVYLKNTNNTIIINNTLNNNDLAGLKAESCKNILIKDNFINENGWGKSSWGSGYNGLYLTQCDYFNISSNEISMNTGYGILLSGKYNRITDNTLNENAFDCIHIDGKNFSILNNYIIGNKYGIYLDGLNHKIQNNAIYKCGLGISGTINDLRTHLIDTSNQINNKILYFYVNEKGLNSNDFFNAGQVILVNSTECDVNNIEISHGTIGFLIYSSENVTISNSNASNNKLYGILAINNCKNITLRQNIANNNGETGIRINSGDHFTLIGNYANNNSLYGISFEQGYNNSIIKNTANKNYIGLYFKDVFNSNLTENEASHNWQVYTYPDDAPKYTRGFGIKLENCAYTILSKNILSNNTDYGIYSSGYNNTFTENYMNDCGIGLSGNVAELSTYNISKTNIVNGNPVYYYKNENKLISNDIINPGQIILINCTNSSIHTKEISTGSCGIFMYSCENITISNCDISYQRDCAIKTEQSSNLNITKNNIENYNIYGLYFLSTTNSIISNNNITNNKINGLFLENSASNLITNNTINNNFDGLYLSQSHSNNITRNYINNNSKYYENIEVPELGAYIFGNGFYIHESNMNNIVNNTVNRNYIGIILSQSNNNNVSQNIVNYNMKYPVRAAGSSDWSGDGIILYAGENNTISRNFLYNNSEFGILLDDRLNELFNNNVTDNNFEACGIDASDAINCIQLNNIDTSNRIDGNPIYIYNNKSGLNPINFTGAGQVCLIKCNNSKISGIDITSGSLGISLFNSHNITIEGNNVTHQNLCGIYSDFYCSNISIFNNNITQNGNHFNFNYVGGITSGGTNITISNNNLNNNYLFGIVIAGSNYSISRNTIDNSGLYVNPYYYTYFNKRLNHKIDISNTVNSKPIYYYENSMDLKPINFSNAGQVILFGCNNSIVSNLDISNVSTPIICEECNNNSISDNKISYSKYVGLYVTGSNNLIENNTIFNSKIVGISANCENTTFKSNYIYNISITDIVILPYAIGLILTGINCHIIENQITNNSDCGLVFTGSNNNIKFNNISGNGKNGIQAESTYDNIISGNIIKDNIEIGIYLGGNYFYTTTTITNNYIYLNELINNGLNARDTGRENHWDDGFAGNYWDDYGGIDINNDGIGDTPYQIMGSKLVYDSKPIIYSIFTDLDNDGLNNYEEYTLGVDNYRTNVTNPDSDYDELTDYWEWLNSTNPWNSDTDFDNMPDGWEVFNSLNPLVDDATDDPDNDLLENIDEYYYGTDPHNSDCDGDSFLDGLEIQLGTEPLDKWWYPMPNLAIENFEAKTAKIGEPFIINFTIVNNGIWNATDVVIIIKIELLDIVLYNNTEDTIDLGPGEAYQTLINIEGVPMSGGLLMKMIIDPNNMINETYSSPDGSMRANNGEDDNLLETELQIIGGEPTGDSDLLYWIIIIAIISSVVIAALTIFLVIIKPKLKESKALKKRIEKAKTDIENFENELQSFIELKLNDQYESLWWEEGVPEYIRNTIENKIELMESKKEYGITNRIRFLDLTHCNLIITNDKNWDRIFSHVFQNKSELESNIESLRIFKNNLFDKNVTNKELIGYPVFINTIRNYFSRRFNIFLSYSTLDTDYFEIKYLVEKLESFPEIDKVLFWEEDSGENIVSYMERTLRLSKVFVLFCSNNSLKSKAVEDEWQAAFQLRKKGLMKIVPVYENEENIPYLLTPLLNVKFTKEEKEEFIEKLYREIIRLK